MYWLVSQGVIVLLAALWHEKADHRAAMCMLNA